MRKAVIARIYVPPVSDPQSPIEPFSDGITSKYFGLSYCTSSSRPFLLLASLKSRGPTISDAITHADLQLIIAPQKIAPSLKNT